MKKFKSSVKIAESVKWDACYILTNFFEAENWKEFEFSCTYVYFRSSKSCCNFFFFYQKTLKKTREIEKCMKTRKSKCDCICNICIGIQVDFLELKTYSPYDPHFRHWPISQWFKIPHKIWDRFMKKKEIHARSNLKFSQILKIWFFSYRFPNFYFCQHINL